MKRLLCAATILALGVAVAALAGAVAPSGSAGHLDFGHLKQIQKRLASGALAQALGPVVPSTATSTVRTSPTGDEECVSRCGESSSRAGRARWGKELRTPESAVSGVLRAVGLVGLGTGQCRLVGRGCDEARMARSLRVRVARA